MTTRNSRSGNSRSNLTGSRPPEPNLFQRFENHVQGKTMAGLMELVPLIVSALVLAFIVRYIDQFIRPLPFVAGKPWDFPGIGLLAAIMVFYLIGLLVSTRVGRLLMEWKNVVLNSIPVVKTIYGVTHQATKSVSSQFGFTRVVFLEWPREGVVAMGFVTGRAFRDSNAPADDDEPQSIVVVYIPTVPNPTSGNLAFVMEDDLFETDMTVEHAMKLVFSGGIVLPDSVSLARLNRVRNDQEFIDRFLVDSH